MVPFEGDSPVRLILGGADRRSISFVEDLDHFYFSKFTDNTRESLRKFTTERYLEDGAALFGRESPEELDDFRSAMGKKVNRLTDRQVKTIVQTSVQRIRNWGHIGSLSQAGIKKGEFVATLDSRTTEICRELHGKQFRVDEAQEAIERLSKLEPGEFAAELYESEFGKAMSRDPVETAKAFIEDDGKTLNAAMMATGRGIPPFHPNCRTRIRGLIAGIDQDA